MTFDLKAHLLRQMAFSHATFGPGERTAGVSDHIRKELEEVAARIGAEGRAEEWVDVVILALDGLTRCLAFGERTMRVDPEVVVECVAWHLRRKQRANEARDWPDWRTADPNKAIEHVKPGLSAAARASAGLDSVKYQGATTGRLAARKPRRGL